MRIALLAALGAVVLLSACKREPTFDERYDTANKAIVDRAKQIDAQIAGTGTPPAESAEPSSAP
ncbi:hypothetical protein [Novosphingobium guangzhouense]|uniref:Argininosuccinate lyase n=1 Tax=Novosphingobium guangzhouense TaxID=1850347 RepID=A0A2K2G536_9SPHN|nr:hypothetical protein [Novosphingobium guangzhouense]PNU06153.1 hypothetical protein A8V01_12415 [Novosphingobium guangzhouense]